LVEKLRLKHRENALMVDLPDVEGGIILAESGGQDDAPRHP
jgi:hypothetical protein